jgi:hypothetical protein
MVTLLEIEAAAKALPQEQKWTLLSWLASQLQDRPLGTPAPHSILDIPPVSVGGVIRLPHPDDDLLGEMLENRL